MQDTENTQDSASLANWNPQRGPDGKFLPGQGGRPKGSRNALAVSTMTKIRDMTPAALNKLEEQLGAGNWEAIKFVLERIIGKGRFVELSGDQPSDVTDALINGEINTAEGKEIASVIESLRKVEEIDAVMKRMDELERLLKG